jgi:hypothetical protein
MNHRGGALKDTLFILLFITVFIAITAQSVCARRYFFMRRPKLGLKLSYEFEEEKRNTGDESAVDRTQDIEERLHIDTIGWVYHPGLLSYQMEYEVGFRQRYEKREEEGSEWGNEYLPSYFLEGTLLRYKPYTLILYGRRDETSVRSAFAERTETKRDSYGADLLFKYEVLPTKISYYHEDITERGFFNSQRERDRIGISSRNQTQNSRTTLNAAYNQQQDQKGEAPKTRSSFGNLSNRYDIKGDGRAILRSRFSHVWSESGDRKSSALQFFEDLSWAHRNNLSSQYNASYSVREAGDSDTTTARFGAGLRHKLYENLTTNVRSRAARNNFTGGSTTDYGLALTLDYNRRIPWGGLYINAGYDSRYTTRNNPEEPIEVIDESHTLTVGGFTLLENDNVVNSSIIVKSANNNGRVPAGFVFIPFDPANPNDPFDYSIEEIDSFTRIVANQLSPNMVFPQPVLVDYSFIPDPSYDDIDFSQRYGVRLNLWSALTLSYNFSHSKEYVVSGPDPDNLRDDTGHSAAALFKWRWTETRFTFEDRELNSSPSTRMWSAEEAIRFRPARSVFSEFLGVYNWRKVKDTGDIDKFYRLRFNIDWLIYRRCKWRNSGFWTDFSGSNENTVTSGVSSSLEFSYRIWRGELKYKFSNEDDKRNEDRRQVHYFLVQLIRVPF